MQWIKKNLTLPVAITLVVLAAGFISAFAVFGVHAEDPKKHLTREVLQREYIPRTELDHRLEGAQRERQQIRAGVERIEAILLNQQ